MKKIFNQALVDSTESVTRVMVPILTSSTSYRSMTSVGITIKYTKTGQEIPKNTTKKEKKRKYQSFAV